MTQPDLLTVREAARLAGVSERRMRQFVADGRVPALRFGNSWLIRREHTVSIPRYPIGGRHPKADHGAG